MKVRNDYFNNAYYVERIIAQRRLILNSIGISVLLVALGLGWWASATNELGAVQLAVSSAVAGMIGAVTSASQRLVAHPATPAPTDLGSFTAVVVRLFIGAVAALTLYFAVLCGFVAFPTHENALLVLASFGVGVGFAERLVVYHPPQASTSPSLAPAPLPPKA
jgi:hypothetical protein